MFKTTKLKAEVENENVTETSKEVGLPETGEDKTNLITTGIVLASIAATITALGSFINKKNYCYYRFKCNRINKVEALIC